MSSPTEPIGAGAGQPATVTLSAEQAHVATEWVVSGRVRLRTRVVTETRTIEVVVRREELVVETADIVGLGPDGRTWVGTAFTGDAVAPPTGPPSVALTLREEYPEIRMVPRPYEQVLVLSRLVTEHVPVTAVVRREQFDVDTAPDAAIAEGA